MADIKAFPKLQRNLLFKNYYDVEFSFEWITLYGFRSN